MAWPLMPRMASFPANFNRTADKERTFVGISNLCNAYFLCMTPSLLLYTIIIMQFGLMLFSAEVAYF